LTEPRAQAYREIGEQLAGWGKVVLLETRGRVTGRAVRTAVGFVEEPDGSLLVAAGSPDADWALNLEEHPRCRVMIGDWTSEATAEALEGRDHATAIRGLILKYGTPAEGLGAGQSFRLRPRAMEPEQGGTG
jgi:deazaflavin-dependent oxidoreductase (nitroreductase family)